MTDLMDISWKQEIWSAYKDVTIDSETIEVAKYGSGQVSACY